MNVLTTYLNALKQFQVRQLADDSFGAVRFCTCRSASAWVKSGDRVFVIGYGLWPIENACTCPPTNTATPDRGGCWLFSVKMERAVPTQA